MARPSICISLCQYGVAECDYDDDDGGDNQKWQFHLALEAQDDLWFKQNKRNGVHISNELAVCAIWPKEMHTIDFVPHSNLYQLELLKYV